ncbi:MAG: hypothetical protein RL238_3310 [Actinomycetota bacterium]|jgi:hypothetical protein
MAFRRPKYLVERTSRGYVVHLQREEAELVARLLGELRGLITSDDPDVAPMLRRLFPPAYHLADDAEAEAEYQKYMREELVASRLASIEQVQQALLSREPLDDAGVQGFMQSVNAVRLVLGVLLDVGEEHDPTDVRDDDPMVGEHHLYAFLSWVLESTVQAITRQGT